MLFLIVVTSVFGIGLCNRVYQEPSSRFPYYLALAKTQLPGLKPSQGAAVKWVTITVGVRTFIYKICLFEALRPDQQFFSQIWTIFA